MSTCTDRERSAIRSRRIGFVFQSFNLLPRTTAVENVEVPALYSTGPVDRAKALALLKRVGLAERANHFVTELSGGEQQRVAIARAFAGERSRSSTRRGTSPGTPLPRESLTTSSLFQKSELPPNDRARS